MLNLKKSGAAGTLITTHVSKVSEPGPSVKGSETTNGSLVA